MSVIKAGEKVHEGICYESLTWIEGDLYNQRKIVSAANKYTLVDGRNIVLLRRFSGQLTMSSTDLIGSHKRAA